MDRYEQSNKCELKIKLNTYQGTYKIRQNKREQIYGNTISIKNNEYNT